MHVGDNTLITVLTAAVVLVVAIIPGAVAVTFPAIHIKLFMNKTHFFLLYILKKRTRQKLLLLLLLFEWEGLRHDVRPQHHSGRSTRGTIMPSLRLTSFVLPLIWFRQGANICFPKEGGDPEAVYLPSLFHSPETLKSVLATV